MRLDIRFGISSRQHEALMVREALHMRNSEGHAAELPISLAYYCANFDSLTLTTKLNQLLTIKRIQVCTRVNPRSMEPATSLMVRVGMDDGTVANVDVVVTKT